MVPRLDAGYLTPSRAQVLTVGIAQALEEPTLLKLKGADQVRETTPPSCNQGIEPQRVELGRTHALDMFVSQDVALDRLAVGGPFKAQASICRSRQMSVKMGRDYCAVLLNVEAFPARPDSR